MKWLDLTLPTPAENLACDEALLDLCDEGSGHEILRCWEPSEYCVVVGYANRVASEVNGIACERAGIPILRRSTGGGTVLQGPGCLNYSLILKMDAAPALRGIVSTNGYVMERNRTALQQLVPRERKIEIQGHTDLVIDGRKFSGNAQRRKQRFLLFHGTILLGFDLRLVQEMLPLPSRQPAYRQNRSHRDFLTNLELSARSVKRAFQDAWNAFDPLENVSREKIRLLARDKYEAVEWNNKF